MTPCPFSELAISLLLGLLRVELIARGRELVLHDVTEICKVAEALTQDVEDADIICLILAFGSMEGGNDSAYPMSVSVDS